ncbi:hypothetical protein DFQ27_009213 [Actinomortierella ambigua]|uniref:Uncharacterized protein n=1 Tax=Actinomortierella ambigua TaxID=1343610 RepID=A0A9P6TXY1_9FUNG|nr:hypothetical protein DFQ27_009213 [Actinomortierella ambigua]
MSATVPSEKSPVRKSSRSPVPAASSYHQAATPDPAMSVPSRTGQIQALMRRNEQTAHTLSQAQAFLIRRMYDGVGEPEIRLLQSIVKGLQDDHDNVNRQISEHQQWLAEADGSIPWAPYYGIMAKYQDQIGTYQDRMATYQERMEAFQSAHERALDDLGACKTSPRY